MLSSYRTCDGKQNPLGLAIGRIFLVRIRLVIPLLRTSSTIQKVKDKEDHPVRPPITRK